MREIEIESTVTSFISFISGKHH